MTYLAAAPAHQEGVVAPACLQLHRTVPLHNQSLWVITKVNDFEFKYKVITPTSSFTVRISSPGAAFTKLYLAIAAALARLSCKPRLALTLTIGITICVYFGALQTAAAILAVWKTPVVWLALVAGLAAPSSLAVTLA